MFKFFKKISPALVVFLVIYIILESCFPQTFFWKQFEAVKKQQEEETLKKAEEIQAQKDKERQEESQMDYGVLLHIMENVYEIEIHEVHKGTKTSYYAMVTLEGIGGLKGNYDYQYRINLDISSVRRMKEYAEEYNFRITEVVDEDTTTSQDSVKESEKKGIDWSSIIISTICVLGVIAILFYVSYMLIDIFKDDDTKGKNKKTNKVAVLNSSDNGKSTNVEEVETEVKIRFSDIAGLDEEIEELKEVVDFIRNPEKYEKLGAKVPKGILLHGKPGTGKTLIAKAVAGEAGVNFVSASGAEFINQYVGTGAKNVRKLFDEARENAPCIVFIDEIDAIGGRRDDEANSERNQTIDQLLTELDGFSERTDIITLAATNRLDMLDPALTRPGRFDRIIAIGLPDVRAREKILKIHAKNKPLSDDVKLGEIAKTTTGFSGAKLANLLNESALIAVRKNQEVIHNTDIKQAFSKITVGIQKNSKVISDKEKQITANHEAGHAIVGMLLPTQSNVSEVSIIPRGDAGGYTMHEQDEDKNYLSKQELTERLVVLMAGRVAEKIFIGDISTGASQDIEVATNIATSMISVYGMGTSVGPISVKNSVNNGLRLLSGKKIDSIGDEVVSLIKSAENEAEKLITEHSTMHQELVQMLLEQETITGEELKKLQSKYKLAVNA